MTPTERKTVSLCVALFALLLGALGTNGAWKVESAMRESDPVSDRRIGLDFDAAFRQYRRSAVVDIATELGALVAATRLYRDRRWGRVLLACVVSAHAGFQLSYRFLPGPRYVPMSRGYDLWFTALSVIVWWWALRPSRVTTAS